MIHKLINYLHNNAVFWIFDRRTWSQAVEDNCILDSGVTTEYIINNTTSPHNNVSWSCDDGILQLMIDVDTALHYFSENLRIIPRAHCMMYLQKDDTPSFDYAKILKTQIDSIETIIVDSNTETQFDITMETVDYVFDDQLDLYNDWREENEMPLIKPVDNRLSKIFSSKIKKLHISNLYD